MTLHILWQMIKRYWWLVIGLPILCMAICFALLSAQPKAASQSIVSANIIVNSQLQTMSGLVMAEVAAAEQEDPAAKIDVKSDTGKMTISVSVTSNDAETGKAIIQRVADNSIQKAEDFFGDLDPELRIIPFAAEVTNPTTTYSTVQGNKRLVPVCGIAGLFVAVLILVLVYSKRRPVVDAETIQQIVGLPMLECLPSTDNGERLLANIRFASNNNNIGSVCLLPVSDAYAAQVAEKDIVAALFAEERDETMDIVVGPSLAESMGAVYESQRAEAAVLCITRWKDSSSTVASAKAELELAKAPLIGLIMLEKHRPESK